MQNDQNIRLTASEISTLWTGYLGDTMCKCMLEYFISKVEDKEIDSVIKYAFSLVNEHIRFKKELFERENIPIPRGFTDEDVNIQAPRLFSDGFMLQYTRQMATAGTAAYSFALSSSSRSDIRDFFSRNLMTATELLNRAIYVLQEKGLYVQAPNIPIPESQEFVKKEGWLNGFIGDRRAVNVVEITHLYLNTLTNGIGKVLMIGFSQVAQSKEVIHLIVRGRDISTKHIEVFRSILQDDQLPAPNTWEADVSGSVEAPFSEKLMLFHTMSLSQLGLGNYGLALSASSRRDLAATYTRLMAEVGTFSDDVAEQMIRFGWMEKIPGAIERDALLKV